MRISSFEFYPKRGNRGTHADDGAVADDLDELRAAEGFDRIRVEIENSNSTNRRQNGKSDLNHRVFPPDYRGNQPHVVHIGGLVHPVDQRAKIPHHSLPPHVHQLPRENRNLPRRQSQRLLVQRHHLQPRQPDETPGPPGLQQNHGYRRGGDVPRGRLEIGGVVRDRRQRGRPGLQEFQKSAQSPREVVRTAVAVRTRRDPRRQEASPRGERQRRRLLALLHVHHRLAALGETPARGPPPRGSARPGRRAGGRRAAAGGRRRGRARRRRSGSESCPARRAPRRRSAPPAADTLRLTHSAPQDAPIAAETDSFASKTRANVRWSLWPISGVVKISPISEMCRKRPFTSNSWIAARERGNGEPALDLEAMRALPRGVDFDLDLATQMRRRAAKATVLIVSS